jgi:secreted trypsin-like serine protease
VFFHSIFIQKVGILVQEPGVPRFCGGVILNENHVLTAGSCVLDTNQNLLAANQLFVRGGKFDENFVL